jgi:L-fuconolactonase
MAQIPQSVFAHSVFDIHPHVIAPDQARYPLSPLGGEQSPWSRERPVSMEAMLAAMDEAGVARSVLVQASTVYGHDNSYVADSVAAHPSRFAGVFSVDVHAADAPERIRHWVGRGLSGLRVFIAGHTHSEQALRLDDPRTFPAWEQAIALGIPVCVQLRAPGLPQLETLLARFPQANVVLDHMARPVLEDGPPYASAAGLFALARFPNLHLKLTIHNVREAHGHNVPGALEKAVQAGKADAASFFGKLVQAFGAKRIAWGSNFPASTGSLKEILGESRQALASLTDDDRDCIFRRTALGLYPSLAK